MKTWIFDEQALDTAIAAWVANQIASGHPKAVANADFVGRAIKDMLETSPKLFKEPKPVDLSPSSFVPSKSPTIDAQIPVKSQYESAPSQQGNFSIDEMKKAWYQSD